MPNLLRFHDSVPADLEATIRWYDELSPRTGIRCRKSVDMIFDRIESFPEMYRMKQEIPLVLGVFHSSSDPDKWRVRADSS